MQTVLDYSVLIIFLTALIVLGIREYKNIMESTQMRRDLIKMRLQKLGNELLIKLTTGLIVSVIISVVVFRDVFNIGAFHAVFITMLIYSIVSKKVRSIIG